jgi:hypothetical protein
VRTSTGSHISTRKMLPGHANMRARELGRGTSASDALHDALSAEKLSPAQVYYGDGGRFG